MSVDITSVVVSAKSDGITELAKALDKLTTASEKAEAATGKLNSETNSTASSQKKSADAVDALLEKLQKQVDLLGANTSQTNAYNAALKGGTDIQVAMAQMLGAEVDAYKSLGAAQTEAISMNKAMDASYKALQEDADKYYASQAKLAANMQALNDAGYRAEQYKKLSQAQSEAIAINNAMIAAEEKLGKQQIAATIEDRTRATKALAAAQTEAIALDNAWERAQRSATKASQEAFNAIGPSRSNLDAFNKSGEQFISNLKAQTDTLGMTSKQLRDYQVSLMQAKAAQLGVSDAAAPMIQSFKDSTIHSSHASSGVSGIARELVVLGHEASQGQYSRFGGSLIVLAERADVAGKAVTFLTEAAAGMGATFATLIGIIAGVAAVVGVLVAGLMTFKHSTDTIHEFNKELILTGSSAGATSEAFYGMSNAIGRSYGSIGEARKAMADLIATGKFTAAQIRDITDSAVGLSVYGGQAVDVTAKQFEKLAKDPLGNTERSFHNVSKAALELNQTLNFLDPLTMQAILNQEKLGNNAEASAIAIKALNEAEKGRVEELKANMTWLGEKAHELSAGFTNMWNSLWVKQPVLDRIKELQDRMARTPLKEQGGYHYKEMQGEAADLTVEEAIKQQAADNKAKESAKNTAAVIAQSWLTSIAEKTKGDTLYQQMLRKNLEQEASLRETNANSELLSATSMAERRAYLLKEYGEKEKKIRAEGTSGIDAELKQIQAAAEWEKRDLESQVSVLDAAYKAKKLSVFDYVDQKNLKLEQEKKVTASTYTAEVEALLLWADQSKRTTSERNIASQKIQELSKQAITQLEKENTAIILNGSIVTDIVSKTAAAQAAADSKVIEAIQASITAIQAKVDAYNRLPETVRKAGVTEKQIQDEITQSYINNMQDEIEQTIKNNNVEDPLIKARLSLLRQEITLKNNLKDLQAQQEGIQTESKFNLGYGARAKEEAAMAVQAFNDAGKTISTGLQSIWGDASKPMQNFFKAMTDSLAKQTAAQEKFNKVKEAYKDAPEALKLAKIKEADIELTREQTQAQLGSYGDIAGAAQSLFDKQSSGYKAMGAISAAFHAAEVAMAIASIAPKIAAGAASMFATLGPFGFVAVAGMLAVMAGLGFSGGGSSSAPPTSATRQAANGTGSVLGNSDAKSESIQKALDTIAKDSGLGLVHFSSMDKSLQTLVAGISGLSSLLVRGTNLTAKLPADSLGSAQQTFSSKVLPFSIGESLTGGALAKLVGNIFGGATSVQDVGLRVGSGTVGSLASGGANVSQYTDTMTKGGWFSSDKYNTQLKDLGKEVNDQFGMVIQSLADTVKSAAETLSFGGDAFEQHLKSFVVDIADISTKGLTGTQIQDALQSAFSKLGDDMAKFAIVGLDNFQKVGEGYLETVARVANDLVQVRDVFDVLGKTLNSTGLGAVQVSEDLIKVFGTIDKLTSATQFYVENFKTESEKVLPIQKSLNTELNRLGIAADISTDQFKALVDQQDLNTAAGQQMFAALMNIAPAFKAVADATDAAKKAAQDLLSNKLAMQLTIADLEHNTEAATAIIAQQRAIELANMDASLRPLQERINLLTDEAAATDNANKIIADAVNAAKAVANSDFSVLKNSVDQAKAAAKSAYDAQVAITNAQISSLQAVNTAVASLSAALDSALSTATEAVGGLSRVSAQALLDQALSKAKSSGVLPTAESIKETLASLAKDSSGGFSSFAEYKRDAGITAGKLAELNTITKTQKSVNDLQLEALQASLVTQKAAYDSQIAGYDQILAYAQLQLDAMNNNIVAVKDLGAALSAFNASALHATAFGQINGTSAASPSATSSQIISLYQSLLGRSPDAGGFAYYTGTGETASSVANSILHSAEYAALQAHGSHANGLDSVPFDGYRAKLHNGEMVLPSKQAKGVAQASDMQAVVEAINILCADNSAENRAVIEKLNKQFRFWQDIAPDSRRLQTVETAA